MIGTITSKISQYVSPGQNKEAGEKKTDQAPVQQKPVESPQTPVNDSFSADNKIAKPSSDPAGSKEFVGLQSSLSQEITGPQTSGTVREYSLQMKTEGVTAERESAPMDRNKPVDIQGNSPEAKARRTELLRNTPQVNKTNGKDGEGMCGGASLAGAMVLDSGKTPEAAQKNAAAIRSVYGDLNKGKKLTPEQDEALKHLASGKISVKDTEQLQKVMYEITQKVHGQGDGGVNIDGMAEAVNMLRAKGGFAGGSDIKFHLNEGGTSRTGGKHWTTTVDGLHVDTWPTNYSSDKPNKGPNYAVVTGAPQGIGKGNDGWVGDVNVSGNSNTSIEYMDPGLNKPLTVTFDQETYKGKSTEDILGNNMTGEDITKAQKFERTMGQWEAMEKSDPSTFSDWKQNAPETYKKYEEWKKSHK